MTIANSKFQNEINNALDLIYRLYKTQPHFLTRPFEKGVVGVYFDDLKEYDFTPDSFLKLFFYLKAEISGFELISGFDEEALMHWGNVGDISIAEPTVCTIRVPNNFEDKYRQLRTSSESSSSIEIIYSDTKGLFRKDGVGTNYPITEGRERIVRTLLGAINSPTPAEAFGKDATYATKAVTDINKNCSKLLGLEHFLILNSGKGYYLNTDQYTFSKEK